MKLFLVLLLAVAPICAADPLTPQQRAAQYLAILDARRARVAQLHGSLAAEFAQLSPGEQALYQPALEGVRRMLLVGNVVEARKIVFLSPVPTEPLAESRARMLAEFTRLFPEFFPQ